MIVSWLFLCPDDRIAEMPDEGEYNAAGQYTYAAESDQLFDRGIETYAHRYTDGCSYCKSTCDTQADNTVFMPEPVRKRICFFGPRRFGLLSLFFYERPYFIAQETGYENACQSTGQAGEKYDPGGKPEGKPGRDSRVDFKSGKAGNGKNFQEHIELIFGLQFRLLKEPVRNNCVDMCTGWMKSVGKNITSLSHSPLNVNTRTAVIDWHFFGSLSIKLIS